MRGDEGKEPDYKSLNNRVVHLVHSRHRTNSGLCVFFDPNNTSKV